MRRSPEYIKRGSSPSTNGVVLQAYTYEASKQEQVRHKKMNKHTHTQNAECFVYAKKII